MLDDPAPSATDDAAPKLVEAVPIPPPPPDQRVKRDAAFAPEGEKRTRYSLPTSLRSSSPIGYRTRVNTTLAEARSLLPLLSLGRPTELVQGADPVTEQELFEETTLGVVASRQSTNFRGHRDVVFGPEDSTRVARLLRELGDRDAAVLDHATHTHVVLARPYRTAFTLLLTFVGHRPLVSLVTVPYRAAKKRLFHVDDMPSIGYLGQLHLGVLADGMERAAIVASNGKRRANVLQKPFCGDATRGRNRRVIRAIEKMAGLSLLDRADGWRLAMVVQVGQVQQDEQVKLPRALFRKLGANLVAFRSERIQPGVNAEEKAPPQYQKRQDMDVPEELRAMAGRAAYNAFSHWTGCDRELAKDLLLLERVDVLTPGGKERLRSIRRSLDSVTDALIARIPLWADLPTLKAFSRNAERGRKAFALAGQRIYIAGLSPTEVATAGIEWDLAVRGVGAAAARASLVAEIMGTVDLPDGCDLLAGCCLMAGPVNQNDVGKTFFGHDDLLETPYPGRGATSLLVWTLKAKTVADPIGNEEQLLNPARKGALVDLRPGPHEVVALLRHGKILPMRRDGDRFNEERAFADEGNFVTDPGGRDIPGNRGTPWAETESRRPLW